jgi:transposase
MRENDGRKLDHHTLEVLRLRAVDQVAAGAHPEEVSRALGMHEKTVYGWLAKVRHGGRDALIAKPVPGRPAKLAPEQMQRVYELVTGSDPRQLSFDFALWTRDLVREMIRREFKVTMSASAVGRLLHRLGLSPQRPLWRAWQADPEKVAAWKDTEYPKIAKQAKRAGATVYFLDEAGIRSDHHAGTTWGKVGATPVVKTTGARFSLNMISAVTAQGKLRFSTFTGSMTADKFIDYCKKLMNDTDGPVFLILDGHPVHRAKKVKAFTEATEGQLRLFQLPGYSPQLNPDEWVWKNVKNDRVGRSGITGPDQFKALAVGALRRLQATPHIVRGFFGDPDLAYITRAAN